MEPSRPQSVTMVRAALLSIAFFAVCLLFFISKLKPEAQLEVSDVFKDKGFLHGAEGMCPHRSPAYPHAYPDCNVTCSRGLQARSASWLIQPSDSKGFIEQMRKVWDILAKFGPINDVQLQKPHVSFMYLCCQTEKDMRTVDDILQSWDWPTFNISFSRLICNMDHFGPNGFNFILLVDDETELRLQDLVNQVEEKAISKGVALNRRRKPDQQHFHMTVGAPKGDDDTPFPIGKALLQANMYIRSDAPKLRQGVEMSSVCQNRYNHTDGFKCLKGDYVRHN